MFLSHVVLESDNQSLIKACRENCVRGETQMIVKDILSLKKQFQHYGFTWIRREGNGVAYCIVSLAGKGNLQGNWLLHPPSKLRSALIKDRKSCLASGT